MFKATAPRMQSTNLLLIQANRNRFCYCATLILAYVSPLAALPSRANVSNDYTQASPDASPLTLVFSDDFSTDPNTSGQWTIHRTNGDPNNEAAWDSAKQSWDLTRSATGRGAAVFANYELTATTWRAEFRYRVTGLGGLQNGGDGFVFMFYKNEAAYGIPSPGAAKGFEVNYLGVKGYGLQFDNYIQEFDPCDPPRTDYYCLIQDDVCTFLGGRASDWTGQSDWHLVQLAFAEGRVKISIDGVVTFTTQIADPDYSFSGVGFGAGTGDAYGTYEIDNFRLWVAE